MAGWRPAATTLQALGPPFLDRCSLTPASNSLPPLLRPAPVSNLAVDLRDGLRLCRLAEALGGRPGLFDTARFPSDKCVGTGCWRCRQTLQSLDERWCRLPLLNQCTR